MAAIGNYLTKSLNSQFYVMHTKTVAL